MPSEPLERPWTEAEIDAIRQRLIETMKAEGLSHGKVAREAGVKVGTFSPWISGNYAGRNDRIAEAVEKWFDARELRRTTQSRSPIAPTFVMTPAAKAFIALMEHAQHMPDFSVITGAPGVGKSSAACHYTRTSPNVWKVVAHPGLVSPRSIQDEICRAAGVHEPGVMHKVMNALVRRLMGSGGLIIIDEAQHLTPIALDQLRSIYDVSGIGVALLGNATVFGKLEGGDRRAQFAQLHSRVGMRISRMKPTAADVRMLLEAWDIQIDAQRELLTSIAMRPGALRTMTKTLKLAHMLAAGDEAEVTEAHIVSAYETLTGQKLGAVAA
jgi:DNA transposition AAA+ family ATPase